jgi:hypothetical protein
MSEKPKNSCVHQFTPNMCGNENGCKGCPSNIQEILNLSEEQRNSLKS